MNDMKMQWCAMSDELLAKCSPDELHDIVAAIQLANALGLLAQHARLTTMRAWAVGDGS